MEIKQHTSKENMGQGRHLNRKLKICPILTENKYIKICGMQWKHCLEEICRTEHK